MYEGTKSTGRKQKESFFGSNLLEGELYNNFGAIFVFIALLQEDLVANLINMRNPFGILSFIIFVN